MNIDGKEITQRQLETIIDYHNVENSKIDLRGADLRYANLWNANLRNAELRYTNLWNANLRNAELRYANLWNANLRNADLRYTNLRYADLRYANLWNANLRNAELRYANLWNANLRNADLWNANLRYADLRYANLQDVDLQNADLQDADLQNVTMNWYSYELIGERLHQHFIGDRLSLELMLSDTIKCNPQWYWDKWFELTDTDLLRPVRDNILNVMKTWVKDGDDVPDILKG